MSGCESDVGDVLLLIPVGAEVHRCVADPGIVQGLFVVVGPCLDDAEERVESELQRRTSPVVVVHDAQALRSKALEWLYSIWNFSGMPEKFQIVLSGSGPLRTVLGRPRLASFRSCVFVWHRLNS
ncbi:ATP-binding protein [Streptomyces lutosisoli]|uniref:ATP-binding protein n=1 Tax=Streptomyces lutosisoli TaxID=2665721 RepID=A0ABW2VWT4_9ACTN